MTAGVSGSGDTTPRAELVRGANGWMRRRACRDMDPGPWFSSKAGDVTHARAVCESCPVRTVCLSWQLECEAELRQVDHGMFGGRTPAERRVMLGLKPLGRPGRPRKVRPGMTATLVLEMLEGSGER